MIVKDNAEYFGFKDNVAIRNRSEKPEIVDYLNSTVDRLQTLNYAIDTNFNAGQVYGLLDADLPKGSPNSNKQHFINDIVQLSEIFVKHSKSKTIGIKIEVVKTDMCRLFHVDNYRQRLLCTYKGPGTEWLEESNVNRKGLGKGCNQEIVRNVDQIKRAKAFDVLLIKGAKYGAKQLGVVHRSPPIEKLAQTRVLLKIDER